MSIPEKVTISEADVISETVCLQPNQDDCDGMDRSCNESKGEQALLIHRGLLAEQQWYHDLEVAGIFMKFENILRTICKRMNLSAKVNSSIELDASNPTTEKLSLVQRTGAEAFKCSVILLGESIIQTEVTIKYPKMPGGVYRATAQPDVQWKLQQLQDADNYFVQALSTGLKRIRRIPSVDIGKMSSTIISISAKVINLIRQARSTLCMPEKHTLLELCNSAVTRSFNPPLPSDLVFSYYISGNRLVCAAYQVTPRANGAQGLTVSIAECLLPQLVDVLSLTDRALSIAQRFSYNMFILKERIHTFDISSHISSYFNTDFLTCNSISPTALKFRSPFKWGPLCKFSLMSLAIKLMEARATLLYVESILYWQANKAVPSSIIIQRKVLPLLYRLIKVPISTVLFTERDKDQLIIIINLLETGLKFCRHRKIQKASSETLDSFNTGRKEAVERTIVNDKSQLPTIDDIVGQMEFDIKAKKALLEAVVDPVLYPEWFATSGHNPWRCVLLYGPPGTDLISTWSGQSEKLIRELFDHASAYNGTSIIFIDEIDSLCRTRQVTEDDNTRRVKTELFLQLQRLHNSSSSVLLICATNCPWELDPAFLRRFEKRIFVGLPDASSRGILLKKFLNKLTMSNDINWTVLETITDGFSGDDLRRFAREVAFLHFNKFKELYNLDCAVSKSCLTAQIPVTAEDFEQTFRKFCPTVDGFTLSRYAEYSKLI
uniref:AAA+ ATPase domain-containing protein n=1 Tax=Setaria digitata TaxID=48799 RepID=A0A915Q4K1_9BILA